MVIRCAGIACREVERLVANQVALDISDRELLERFSGSKDDVAFNALVRRHGGMVFAVARRILANTHDAEDVCQAVFLLLAQKAASCQWQPSIANWLHQTAYHLSLKARTAAARRCRREKLTTTQVSADPLNEMTGQELLAILDEELLALPELLRAPLVLCYLGGATQDEAANRLSCLRSTLKKRLERGRSRLHAALVKRGVGLSVTLLGTLVAQNNAAARAVLAQNIVQVARNLASGSAAEGAISSNVRRLIQGGVGMVGWSKLKTCLCLLVVSGAISLAAAFSFEGRSIQSPPEVVAVQTPKNEPLPKVAAIQSPQSDPPLAQSANSSIKVIVLDAQGKPLSDATVHAEIVNTRGEDSSEDRELKADAEGVVQVELPKTFTHLRLWPEKKRFASVWAIWDRADVPAEYTFQMEPGTTVGGRVLDEQGKPIAGAKVDVSLEKAHKDPRGGGRFDYVPWLASYTRAVTTDHDGRWQIDNLPDITAGELLLIVTHPDFISSRRADRDAVVPTKIMREGKSTLTLKSGVVVQGRVTDPDGRPVKDATIISGDDPICSVQSKCATDAVGKYRLVAVPTGRMALTVIAPGWAPQCHWLELKPSLPAQDFCLARGKPIRLRIVDSNGKPVPEATVSAMHCKECSSIWETYYTSQSGKDGVWEWPSAPDGSVYLEIEAKGFIESNLTIADRSMERTVTLKTNHRITGMVTDAITGQPIPEFTVIPMLAFGTEGLFATPLQGIAGKNGKLDFLPKPTDRPLRLRILAPGYRTEFGPEFLTGGEDGRIQNFRLQPSKPLTGVILDANGQPAAKLEVSLATPTMQAMPKADPQRFNLSLNYDTVTDANGRFTFPDQGEPWAVFAQSTDGIAFAEFSADQHDAGTLKLQPWASIRGKYSDNGKPVSNVELELRPIRPDGFKCPRVNITVEAKTDRDGRFEFPRVPPGPVSLIQVSLSTGNRGECRKVPCAPIETKPGEQVNVEIDSRGAVLSGKITLTAKNLVTLDHNLSRVFLACREHGAILSPRIPALELDSKKLWGQGIVMTDQANSFLNARHRWCVAIESDGSFQISGVPEGEYDLVVDAYGKSDRDLTDSSGQKVIQLKVTAGDVTRGKLAVAEIAVEVKKTQK